jgi:hypothetical protein
VATPVPKANSSTTSRAWFVWRPGGRSRVFSGLHDGRSSPLQKPIKRLYACPSSEAAELTVSRVVAIAAIAQTAPYWSFWGIAGPLARESMFRAGFACQGRPRRRRPDDGVRGKRPAVVVAVAG